MIPLSKFVFGLSEFINQESISVYLSFQNLFYGLHIIIYRFNLLNITNILNSLGVYWFFNIQCELYLYEENEYTIK